MSVAIKSIEVRHIIQHREVILTKIIPFVSLHFTNPVLEKGVELHSSSYIKQILRFSTTSISIKHLGPRPFFVFDSNLAISEPQLSVVQMLQKLVHRCFLPWFLFAPLLPLMQINNIALLKLQSCHIWQGEHKGNAGESGITDNFPELLAGASHTSTSSFPSGSWLSSKQGGWHVLAALKVSLLMQIL